MPYTWPSRRASLGGRSGRARALECGDACPTGGELTRRRGVCGSRALEGRGGLPRPLSARRHARVPVDDCDANPLARERLEADELCGDILAHDDGSTLALEA